MIQRVQLKKQGLFIVMLLSLLTMSSVVQAITVSDYSGFPKDFSNFNLGVLSPVVVDLDPSLAGFEVVVVKNQASGYSTGMRLVVFYSDGTSFEKTFLGMRTYSSPAVADLDGNASNGLEIVFAKGQTNSTLDVYYANGTELWSIDLSGEGTSPALADLDGDGVLEIILGEGSSLGVYYANSTQKFSYALGAGTSSAPAVGDLNGDGSLDIVAVSDSGVVKALSASGTLLWSYSTGSQISTSAPAVGDLDNDGDLEVVAATQSGVYAFYGNGSLMSGWPKSMTVSTSSPALGDIDGDGSLEIVVGEGLTGSSRLFALHHNGTVLFETALDSYNIGSSPVLADLDGDAGLETVIGYNNKAWSPRLSIIDSDGLILNTVSLSAVVSESTAALGDLNGDGKAEIVFTTEGSGGKIHVLTTDADFDPGSAPWPMYHRDSKNTGVCSPVAATVSPVTGASFGQDESVSLVGSAFSVDGALAYSWFSDLDGSVGSGSSLSGVGLLSLGTHSVWLRVTDLLGRSDNSSAITITITNDPPTANITAPLTSDFEKDEGITFNGTGYDSDGTISLFEWDFDGDGIYDFNSSISAETTYSYPAHGTYNATLRVTDNNGDTETDTKTVTINNPPTAEIFLPLNNSAFKKGKTLQFNGTGTDIDGSITSYRWTADGFLIGTTATFTSSLSTVGTKTIVLTVTDDKGANGTATVEITIQAANKGGSSGDGPSGGGFSIISGGATVFDGKGVLSEPDFKDLIEFFGHDYGGKYSFTPSTAPLVSVFASQGEVVMMDRLSKAVSPSLRGFETGLKKKEDVDVYSEAAAHILLNRPGFVDLVVIRGDMYYDSLAASPFAQVIGAPIIFVKPDEIPEVDYEILRRMNGKGRIYIIGGIEAVSPAVEAELSQYAGTVVRLGGETRYETSIKIAQEMLDLTDSSLVISVNGREPVLYSATLATKYRAPIVFIDSPPQTESTFRGHAVGGGGLDTHQQAVYDFISEQFDTIGLMYYQDTIEG